MVTVALRQSVVLLRSFSLTHSDPVTARGLQGATLLYTHDDVDLIVSSGLSSPHVIRLIRLNFLDGD